jgi:uncharacterized protein YdaU (DUF1376 family)
VNYYEHHIGDYAAATGHLSLVEDAVYSRMLRRYYLQEGPLPSDSRQIARLVGARAQDELDAVEAVLAEFFDLLDDGWHQKRADEDIAVFRTKQLAKSDERDAEAERKRRYRERRADLFAQLRDLGIVPSFDTTTDELVRILSRGTALGQDADGTATQSPVTSHQSPVDQKQKGGKPPALTLPDWLPESTWADWHAFRNQRKGWTHKARELSLSTLTKLRTRGHDPTAVIEQSIERGWTGLFELKSETSHANNTTGRKLSAVEQVEQAIRERRAREPDDEEPAFAQIGHG